MIVPILSILAFHLIWFLIGVPIAWYRVRADWDPKFSPSDGGLSILWAAGVVHMLIPIAGCLVAMEALPQQVFGAAGVGAALFVGQVIFLFPYLAGTAGLFYAGARWKRKITGDPLPSHARIEMCMGYRGIHLVVILCVQSAILGWSGFRSPYGPAPIASAVFAVLYASLRAMRAGRVRKSARFDMPDSPLRDEILTLYRLSAKPEKRFVVQPQRQNDPFQLSPFNMDHQKFQQIRVIPSSLLHSLEPRAFTAILSCELLKGHPIRRRREPVNQSRLAVATAGLGISMMILLLSLVGTAGQPVSGSDLVILILFLLLLAAPLVLFWQLWRAPASSDCFYREAFLNWHDADPEADRTVEEFIVALAQGEAVREGIRDPEVLVHRMRNDRVLMAFLDLCGPDYRERALALVPTALDGLGETPAVREAKPAPNGKLLAASSESEFQA